MENKKILVVDDEPDMRIFVSTVVETAGFEPITARNGPEALEKASEVGDGHTFMRFYPLH